MTALTEKSKPVSVKTDRIELKTSSESKSILRQAAAVYGVDLTAFILQAAMERAQTTLVTNQVRALTAEAFEKLEAVIQSESKPTDALVSMAKRGSFNATARTRTTEKVSK